MSQHANEPGVGVIARLKQENRDFTAEVDHMRLEAKVRADEVERLEEKLLKAVDFIDFKHRPLLAAAKVAEVAERRKEETREAVTLDERIAKLRENWRWAKDHFCFEDDALAIIDELQEREETKWKPLLAAAKGDLSTVIGWNRLLKCIAAFSLILTYDKRND